MGLITLDLVYRVAALPDPNQKLVASDSTVAAGGPATNAAIAFRYLGNAATVVSLLGCHAITPLIRADLEQWGVTLVDLEPSRIEPPPVSSILVTEQTGDRAVVSLNASRTQARVEAIPADILQDVTIVLVDAHQIAVGAAIARLAQAQNIPVVLDGGSWKPGLEQILPWVDYAICSANFLPPGCTTLETVFAYLHKIGIPNIAVTQGGDPIQYQVGQQTGTIPVPPIQPVDTLGAGDVFHGAFCHAILHQGFPEALEAAARVAARSCQFFGTRRWMEAEAEYSG